MNAKNLIVAAVATLAVSGAFAQFVGEATYEKPVAASTSSVTRAEVKADLALAQANGQVAVGEASYQANKPVPSAYAQSPLSREAVQAEVLRANQSGELAALNGEASYSRPVVSASTRSREDVRNETISYFKSLRTAN